MRGKPFEEKCERRKLEEGPLGTLNYSGPSLSVFCVSHELQVAVGTAHNRLAEPDDVITNCSFLSLLPVTAYLHSFCLL